MSIQSRNWQIVAMLFLLAAAIVFNGVTRVRSQEAQPTPEKVNQHWKIVNCAPVDLQHELEVLNAAGISVSQSQIVVVGDKFTIMTSDPEEGAEGN